MKKIKAIIFDYDGVIVDSFRTIHNTYKEICDELGVVCPTSFDEFRKIYGYSAKEAMVNLRVKREDVDRFDGMFRKKIVNQAPKPFKGIQETIAHLSKEYRLFLITSNIYEEAVQKLRKFRIFDYFDLVEGDRGVGHRHFKKSEMIKEVMDMHDFNVDEIVYIGDRDIDWDIGNKVGLKHTLLVEYGWGYSHDKIRQEFSIEKPADIIKAIDKLVGE